MSREDYEDKGAFGNDEIEAEDEELEEGEQPEGEEEGEEESPEREESDESDSDEEEEAPSKDSDKSKKRDKSQTRINILQRERYRALHERDQMAAELEQWKQQAELSKQVSIRQQDTNANYRLEKARNAQIAAIESGDAQAQADAQMELVAATTELHTLKDYKQRDEFERQARQYEEPQEDYQPDPEVLNSWFQDNLEWADPSKKTYDRELVEYVGQADTWLANQLRVAGRHREIGGSDYLHEIDSMKERFLQNRKSGGNQESNQRRELNMRQSRSGASPVRNSGQTSRRQGSGERLSSEHEALANVIGDRKIYEQELARFRREQRQEEAIGKRRF